MKKITAFLIAAVILLSAHSVVAFADDKNEAEEYPFVFVHGLMGWGDYQLINDFVPYWGTTAGDVLGYLERQGYDVCAATIGGNSSAWDRACELYAQLVGTTVDYGKAHSEEHGHARFGRTYSEPLCESFGKRDENGDIIKINLIGHSMGGVTVRLFASILEYGVPEEVAAGEDVSDFFKGGKGEYIHSITTLSAPHNGSLAADKDNLPIINIMVHSFYYIWGVLDNTPLRPLWDIQLEHFGFTDYPADGFEGSFDLELIESMLNSKDCAYYDLTLKGAAEANERIRMLDNVYYYSYHSECVFEGPVTGRLYPEITMNPLFLLTSPNICRYDRDELYGIPVDESWRVNDGIVSTNSAHHPDGEPYKDFDAENVETGIWNVMPLVESMDHTDYMGVFCNPFKIRRFYIDVCENANRLN
ncbi:MAG: hypothetical protein J6L91_02315 [Clostridia bacterium]|nr:hypothetical protein [Clostridia bacterium]